MTSLEIDLASPAYRSNPFPVYAQLRDEHPVHYLPNYTHEGEDVYVLSRYDDVDRAFRDATSFSSQIRLDGYLNLPLLVNRDNPDHGRIRKTTNRSFTGRAVQAMEPWISELVDELIEGILADDRVEFVDAYSTMLPLRVISALLGIPLDRKADLRRWSHAVMDMFAVAGGMDPDEVPGFFEDVMAFSNYMDDRARERRQQPSGGDVLGLLVEAEKEGTISRDELTVTAWAFVAAGHETTMNLLGGGILHLVQNPKLLERLIDVPSDTAKFIEEYLRMYPPTQWVLRRAKIELDLHGVTIPEGGLVHVIIGSANRDPRQFERPDEFDIDRPKSQSHQAFGGGSHFCPGATLSRLLAEKTFQGWYPHIGRLAEDPNDPAQLRLRQGSYGYSHLPFLIKAEV